MNPSYNLFLRSASLASILGLGGMQSAQAAALTWTGATNSDLNTTTNWSPNADPSGDNLIFSNNVNTTIGITSDITIAGVANGISFNSGAGAFTIGAANTVRKLTFSTVSNNGINVSSGVTTNQTINANLTFGGDSTTNTFRIQNYGTGLLKMNGTVGSGGSNKTLALAGTGDIELTNVLGAAASTALNVNNTGIVTLSGNNTYAGKVTVSSGALVFQKTQANSTAAPGTNTVAAGATIGLGVGGTGTYGVSNVTDLFNGTLAEFNSISTTCNVGIDTTPGNFDYTASAPSTTRGLMKLGANTLTLSGTNTYTGVTTVRAGTLKVNSGGVINNDATSGGTGTVIGGATLDIDGGTVNFIGANALVVGDNTTTGNVIVRAGSSLNLTGAIPIGQGSSGVGNTPVSTFTLSGGTTTIGTSSTLYLGNFRGATMDIQGGTLTSASSAYIGIRGNSTLTISGASTAVTFTSITLGLAAGSLLPTADLNLNGGTLNLGASGITKAVTDGTKTVSFDGGTLKANATSADFVNADFIYVKAGGATIDTDIHEVTIDNALIQSGVTVGALTKTGAGKLTLSNANTYAGNTDVRTGTLVLAAASSQKFYPKADASSNKITDTNPIDTEPVPAQGIVNLDGAFAIDLTAAIAAANGTEWLLVDVANLAESYGSTFSVTDFTETPADSGIWKRTAGSNTYTFTEGTGKLSLAVGTSNTYADWLTANSPATGFNTDSDNDGVSNGVENVLGTNPNVSSAGLTNVSATTSSATYQHTLNPTIASDVSYSYEWSTDLVEWKGHGDSNTGGTIATITPSTPVSGVVTVTTAITFGPTTKLFTRLKVNKP